jgi:histidinol-phosphatase (PHP family)
MDRSQLAGYIDEVEQARDEFAGQLTIRVGLEADYHPGSEAYVEDMIASYDWDYIIGSVHYIGSWGFDNPDYIKIWDDWDINDAYCAYFDLVAASAATGLFDIIGHPDLIKKFGHRPGPDSRPVADAQERMLQSVLGSGAALEISSAGLRKPVQEIYPHHHIVARAAELGICFAFGSDAHAPGDVGHGIEECISMLESCGIKEIASFQQRQRTMIDIRP